MKKHIFPIVFLLVLIVATTSAQAQTAAPQAPLGSGFTYQGQLKDDAGNPVNATCDFRFTLWDDAETGAQIGAESNAVNVTVAEGRFTAQVNAAGEFGATAFTEDSRWLEIGVRCPAGSGEYTTLAPRQPLTPAPYASYALGAPWSGLSGVPAGFADGADNDTTYTAGTGLTLTGAEISVDFAGSGTAATSARSDHTHTTLWRTTGNSQTDPNVNFIGTIDNVALVFKVNSLQALRLEPNATSPNLIGGYSGNSVTAGIHGATIGGGGQAGATNRVTAHFGTVSGGLKNTASAYGAVGGGWENTASGGYSVVGGGVFKSVDGGGSWNPASTGLTSANVYTLAIDPATPATLYAGTNDGVFKSTNGGGIWSAINTGLTSLNVQDLAIDPATPATLYAGTTAGGVFKSVDGGERWNPANTGLTNVSVQALAIDPAAPTRLYAGTDGGGVFKSTNGGESWSAFNAGLTNTVVYALAVDPATPATLYAGTYGGGVFVYQQAGTTLYLPLVVR
jgi:hypothetical protein